MSKLCCSACGGTEHLRPYSPFHHIPICRPCFMVWYDAPESIDSTDPKQVGELSLKLKAAGRWPWVGTYAQEAVTRTSHGSVTRQ